MDSKSVSSKLPGATLAYMLTVRVAVVVVLFVVSFFIKLDASQVSPLVVSGGIIVLGILVVIFTVLYYNLFSYVLTSNDITINSGVILRESKTINFDKMQNVNAARDPFLMAFGLTRLEIWTASPGQMGYSAVSFGQNGQRTAVPKPKPEATLILLKDDAEIVRNSLTLQNVTMA